MVWNFESSQLDLELPTQTPVLNQGLQSIIESGDKPLANMENSIATILDSFSEMKFIVWWRNCCSEVTI